MKIPHKILLSTRKRPCVQVRAGNSAFFVVILYHIPIGLSIPFFAIFNFFCGFLSKPYFCIKRYYCFVVCFAQLQASFSAFFSHLVHHIKFSPQKSLEMTNIFFEKALYKCDGLWYNFSTGSNAATADGKKGVFYLRITAACQTHDANTLCPFS